MGIVLIPLILVGLVSFVCWIMTLVKIFKSSVGLGILGIICGLFAFIYGWIKTNEFDNRKVMVIWSIAIAISIILQIISGSLAASTAMHMPTPGN